jgi:serine protease Do
VVLTVGHALTAGFPAIVKRNAVTLISVLQSPRGKPACWLLAVALSVSACLAEAPSPEASFARPAVLHPARVNTKDLPAAFSKPAPASLADLRAIQDHVAALVAQVSPAVVAVELTTEDGSASGSGVVISSDGLVLTAGHVGERRGHSVTFTFPDGRTATGKTLGVDEDSDTGLMRITDPGPWPHASVGDLKNAHLGDWALALGNPGGFDAKRSLVVRLGRIIRLMPGVVQTDCTIFPGDSGGPLFDMYGRVIGIHTAIASSAEENFHVSITEFFDTWQDLIGPLEVPPAYSGLSVVDGAEGCRLSKIERNSPASRVNLREGDQVLKVDGHRINVSATFNRWMAESGPGETLRLEIKRGDKVFTVPIKLQSQPRSNK